MSTQLSGSLFQLPLLDYILMHSQTFHPVVDMQDVNLRLLDATRLLRDSLVAEMEASQEDPQSIERVRGSEVNLPVTIPWDAIKLSYRSGALTAAYQRYCEWHGTSSKRRHPSTAISSRKKQKDANKTSRS